jgi:cystathionine beta-lyase/cystathionine gamma-synthase
MQFRTRAIHVGQEHDPATGAVVPPIHLASTFVQPDASMTSAYDYARTGSPTRHAFERTLADLDGGVRALAFASGMAATHGATLLLAPGDEIVTGTDIYGGTWRLFNRVLAERGIAVKAVNTADTAAVARAVGPQTKLVWVESPGNPLLTITDIAACAEIAHAAGALLTTPALSRPLELGADIVMHSATKSIGGHSDLLGGALVVRDPDLGTRLHWLQNATGAVMGPLEAFLCSRGLKTLELRVLAQSATALRLAEWLVEHPAVERVHYPGLASHPGHALAMRQMAAGGTIVSFEVKGSAAEARRVVESTRLFQLAVSLGAVESLIEIPAVMSHGSYAPEARRAVGIADGLVRLSVGLEAFEDLRDDLASALPRA